MSADTIESHKKFAKQYRLPFPLVSDASHEIARAYGVPVTPGGFHERVTFVIDENGTVEKVFPHVVLRKGETTHIDEVLDTCQAG